MNTEIKGTLVAFSYGLPAGSKRDLSITREVLTAKGAEDDAGAWSNKLFPAKACGKKNAYTLLRAHLAGMRLFVYQNTYVFEDSVWRILPEKRTEVFQRVIQTDGRAKALGLLEEFIAALPELKEKARQARGEAYRDEDYPTEGDVRDKFYYRVEYRPVPNSATFGPLGETVFREAVAELNALHHRRLAEANLHLVERFIEPFKLLAEQLKDPGKRRLAPVIERIKEFCAVVPQIDLAGNEQLLAMVEQAKGTFELITPEVLRKDEEMAKLAGNVCENVVSALGSYGQQGVRKFA